MAEKTIVSVLKEAREGGYGIGAFNILDCNSAWGVVQAAEECNVPVILQTSVGTVKYYGPERLAQMIAPIKAQATVPVFLHLDHCTDVDFAKRCVDAGWDSIMIDASAKSFAENVRLTREAADYAHEHGVFAEGELGIIEGVEEEIAFEDGELADYSGSLQFVKESHIDIFAPAIGTAHGVYKKAPKLKMDLVEQLGQNLDVPIVCHGGTGLSDETFGELIRLGISKVNVSTALKHAFLDSAKEYLEAHPDEYAPMKFVAYQQAGVKNAMKHFVQVFARQI